MEDQRKRQRVLELFEVASSLAPQEREHFLTEAASADAELCAEVEALLAVRQDAGKFLSTPIWDAAPTLIHHIETPAETHSLLHQRLGRYQIEAQLGQGGMGEVFLASDLTLGRKVALKILSAKFTADPQLVRRFEREAKAVSALNHPNILTIYEIGKAEEAHFIATEFVSGETLRQRLKRAPMTIQNALDVVIQIATALLAAHEAGIIHRDIKPENIMIRHDGQVKVLDFGLAKFTEKAANQGDSATQTGIIMGTPGYMSPEQARALQMDGRTDIFSLGIVLYEMIAGSQPFAGATSIDVITAILQQEPAPLARHNPNTPTALQRIVSKALQKEQAARYQSVKELLADLQEVRSILSSEIGPKSSLTTAASTQNTIRFDPDITEQIKTPQTILDNATLPVTRRRSSKWLTAVIAASLLIGIATTGIWVNKKFRQTVPASQMTEQKLYSQMTETEREAFIGQKAQVISALLGERPTPLNSEAVKLVKHWIDSYASRVGTDQTKPGEEDLRLVFARAPQYAPTIIQTFSKHKVPPIAGLYIPLIEREYRNEAAEDEAGAAGLFNFVGPTAWEYGVSTENRTNVSQLTAAAAKYLAARMSEFGSDSESMLLVLAGYNRSPNSVRRDLVRLRAENPNLDRSFWSLVANKDKLDHWFQQENSHYVPRFYAAAIMGENPQIFGLTTRPLTSYAEPASTTVEQKPYQQMTEAEQVAFIQQKAQEISAMLGERPTPLNAEAITIVKYWLDAYTRRIGTGNTRLWAEDLNFLFQRAETQYAPIIAAAFKKSTVPPIVGLYLPVVEVEYRNIATENFAGTAGLFQLLGPTVKEYGFTPSDRTNVEKMAGVAAQVIADRMIEFGGDSKSMTLVLLSFNRSPDKIRQDLVRLRKIDPNIDRSFWSMVAHKDKLDEWFQREHLQYVPRFFAAAIIGENPKIFGLVTQPLSSYTEPKK